jgi:hypothetical protein
MLLGQFKASLRLTLTVWAAKRPDTFRAKLTYLSIFWSNTFTVVAELVRALRRASEPA